MNSTIVKNNIALILVFVLILSISPSINLTAFADEVEIEQGEDVWIDSIFEYSYSVYSEGSTDNGADGSVSVSETDEILTVTATNSKYVKGDCGDTQPCSTTTNVIVKCISSRPITISAINSVGLIVDGISVGDTLTSGNTFSLSITAEAQNNSVNNSGTIDIQYDVLTSLTITAASSPYLTYSIADNTVAQNGNDISFIADFGSSIDLPQITAPSGMKFVGWRVGASITNESSFLVDNNAKVYPILVEESVDTTSQNYLVGNNYYTFWEDAVGAAAAGNDKTVIVNRDFSLQTSYLSAGVAPTGGKYTLVNGETLEYIVPSGVTFLIPFDEANTIYTTSPALDFSKYSFKDIGAYRTLTLSDNTVISVEDGGKICVPSKKTAGGQGDNSYNGVPYGKHGKILLNGENSKIVLNDGAGLYVYGYISGSGEIEAKSGSEVYECFQIRDWHGGTATKNMVGEGIFPMSQYYIQNIEAKLKICAGANEICFTGVNASNMAWKGKVTFVGQGGMFELSSGYALKWYNSIEDRLIVELYPDEDGTGEMKLQSVVVETSFTNVDSSNFTLPINGNISVEMKDGVSLEITQDLTMMAGAELAVDEGAELTIAADTEVIVLDASDADQNYNKIGYTSTTGGAPNDRAAITDASVDINGIVNVNGGFYTTSSGAAVTSSNGTGVVIFSNAAGQDIEATQAVTNKNSATGEGVKTETATPVQLKNSDSSLVQTENEKANTTVTFSNGEWKLPDYYAIITYDKNSSYATGDQMASDEILIGVEATIAVNSYLRTGYTFSGWNTASDGTGDAFEARDKITLPRSYINGTADENGKYPITLYAQWAPIKYTITWKDDENNIIDTTTAAYDSMPVAPETNKERTEQYSYTFTRWEPEIATVTGDATYTAIYEKTINKYTVMWKNWDGAVLETDENVEYGSTPSYDGSDPVRAATAEYTYSFAGWTPTVETVTSDVTYTATYNQTARIYTVTYLPGAEDSSITDMPDEAAKDFGTTVVLPSSTPTRDHYTFTGWTSTDVVISNGSFTMPAKNVTLTANWEIEKYTVTWKNFGDNATVLEIDENVPYGTIPTYDGSTPMMPDDTQNRYTFTGWDPEISAVTEDTTYTAQYTSCIAPFTGHGMTLSTQIGVKFYVVPESYSDGDVKFTINGDTVNEINGIFDTDSYGDYFVCYINSIQMADKITATYSKDEVTATDVYSAKDYIDFVKDHPGVYGEKTVDLVKAIGDYGYYMQQHLNDKRSWKLVTEINANDRNYPISKQHIEMPCYNTNISLSGVDLSDYEPEISGDKNYIKTQMTLNGETTTNIFLYVFEGNDGTVTVNDSTLTSFAAGNEYVRLWKSAGIFADDLSEEMTIVVNQNGRSLTISNVSALSYVSGVMNGEYEADQKNAAAALYNYHIMVQRYKDAGGNQ